MKKSFAYLTLVTVLGLAILLWLWPRSAEHYFNRGCERIELANQSDAHGETWWHKWYLNGALADFTRAIKRDPTFVAAYRHRGKAEQRKGDFERALADFDDAIKIDPNNAQNHLSRALLWKNRSLPDIANDYKRAIELDPQNVAVYLKRAEFWENQNDSDAALADYTRAIEVDPKCERAYSARAQVKNTRGDLSGVLADLERVGEIFPPVSPALTPLDFAQYPASESQSILKKLLNRYDRAIAQDPDFSWGYYSRGVFKYLRKDFEGALADFQRCFEFPDDRLKNYAAIHIWLVHMDKGDKTKADQFLSDHLQTRDGAKPRDWEMQIGRFLLDQISETDFFAAISSPDAERERSQFWYYAGMKKLIAGDKTKAADYFCKSRSTETRPYAVQISTQIKLSMLAHE